MGIRQRVRAARPKTPTGIERSFIKDEIEKDKGLLRNALNENRRVLARVRHELSFLDWLRFCKFINKAGFRQCQQLQQKKEKAFERLNAAQNGELQLQYDNIINLAGIELTDIEKDILCRALRFGIPPIIKKEKIFAEFELAWQHLPTSTLSKEIDQECRAGL